MTTINKGNTGIRVVEGSETVLSVDGNSGTAIYRGLYTDLLAARPSKGSELTFEGIEFIVLSSKVRRDRGELGTLTIALGDPNKSGGGEGEDEPGVIIELDFSLVEKLLESHPIFDSIFRSGGSSDLQDIQVWDGMGAEYARRRARLQIPKTENPDPDDDADWQDLSEGAAKYAAKKLSGTDSYVMQVPIVRRTSTLKTPTSSSSAGERDVPPKFSDAADVWLKTADKMISTKKFGAWERIEEWSGFDSLDDDLYPVGGSGSI